MNVNHCSAILLGLWMIVSAASDARADCGYYKRLWLWPEGAYCKNYCDFGLCFMRQGLTAMALRAHATIHHIETVGWVFR